MSYEWMDEAICAQTDPELWFPEVGGSHTAAANRLCGTCPVRVQCGEHAQHVEGGTSEESRYGTWAATSPRERALASGERYAAARDRAAVRLSGRGLTADEVADQLGCSARTVARALATARRQGVAA